MNDAPATFLLDSASEYSVVSSRLFGSAGLQLDRTRGRDFAEDVTISTAARPSSISASWCMPFDPYYARGRRIDGLVGLRPVLAFRDPYRLRCAAARDLAAERVQTHPRRPSRCRFNSSAGYLVVASTVRLPGGRALSAQLVVDTGASQSVILRYPFANENGLFELAGDLDAKTSVAPGLASGDLRLVEVPVEDVSVSRWTFDRPLVQAHREPRIGRGDGVGRPDRKRPVVPVQVDRGLPTPPAVARTQTPHAVSVPSRRPAGTTGVMIAGYVNA